MRQTQIYLNEETYNYLKRESSLSKKTISELIREALKEKMTNRRKRILKALNEVKGLWKREINLSEFLRNIREDRTVW